MTKYKIIDWAGNECIGDERFNSFEDAWDAIHDFFDELDGDELDAELGEYQVVAAGGRLGN